MQTLFTPDAFTSAISEVLSDSHGARVVFVAYVGRYPLQWLPKNLKGIQLYCWPQAGATHPDGIDALIGAGVEVHFVERLHAKIYWSEHGGAVVGSANLSQNGLEGGLLEAGVRLDPGVFNLDAALGSLTKGAIAPSSKAFGERLEKLRREHISYCQRNPDTVTDRPRKKATPLPSFGGWLASPQRKMWQVNYWTEEVDWPKDTIAKTGRLPLEDVDPLDLYEHFTSDSNPHKLHSGVPTLEFGADKDEWKLNRKRDKAPFWWYPEEDESLKFETTDKRFKKHPYVWVCRKKVPSGAEAPFNATEDTFLEALDATVRVLGDKIERLSGPMGPASDEFIDVLTRNYRSAQEKES
jgi:hypothetical protein